MSAYDQNIVIDLEFNLTDRGVRARGLRQEIVEIGAVRLDAAGRTIDEFSCFVKPEFAEGMHPSITALTGIRDCDVAGAVLLADALAALCEWIGRGRTRMVEWSKSDREQIERECAFKGLEVPAQMHRWLDLQVVCPKLMEVGNGRLMKLSTALDWYGVDCDEARAHRALYDAQVTAELLRQVITGEYREQRAKLDVAMPRRKTMGRALTTTIGSVNAGLEALRQSLLANEQLACAMAAA